MVHESEVEVSQESYVPIRSFKLPATKVTFHGNRDLIERLIWGFNLLRAEG